jgi:hypothetical protein
MDRFEDDLARKTVCDEAAQAICASTRAVGRVRCHLRQRFGVAWRGEG